ncbi:MAG: hypothetical protein N2444_07310 [Methylocystis sp.]|nr:hypothetical protein [Methylocystis sp.]
MPQLGLSVHGQFESHRAPADKYGRRVRFVEGVELANGRQSMLNPVFVKFAIGLAIVAAVAMSAALWRLFTFPH